MNAQSAPWLSVVMPTYNGARHLEAALESILAQGTGDLELVAVDDGSTDGTLELLRRYETRLRLRLFPRARIGNWVANTNFGMARARGRYISFLHQDDVWLPERLACLRPLAERHPDAGLLLHASWFIDEHGRRVGRWTCPLPRHVRPIGAELFLRRLMVQNFIAIPAPLIKRETAVASGPLREELWFTADWDFWSRLAQAAPVLYLPRTLAAFRIHPASQTALGAAEPDDLRRQIETVVDSIHTRLDRNAAGTRRAKRVADFSTAVTVMLAAAAHRRRHGMLGPLLRLGLTLGPAGWGRFLRDSRIAERVGARLRAGMLGQLRDDRRTGDCKNG